MSLMWILPLMVHAYSSRTITIYDEDYHDQRLPLMRSYLGRLLQNVWFRRGILLFVQRNPKSERTVTGCAGAGVRSSFRGADASPGVSSPPVLCEPPRPTDAALVPPSRTLDTTFRKVCFCDFSLVPVTWKSITMVAGGKQVRYVTTGQRATRDFASKPPERWIMQIFMTSSVNPYSYEYYAIGR